MTSGPHTPDSAQNAHIARILGLLGSAAVLINGTYKYASGVILQEDALVYFGFSALIVSVGYIVGMKFDASKAAHPLRAPEPLVRTTKEPPHDARASQTKLRQEMNLQERERASTFVQTVTDYLDSMPRGIADNHAATISALRWNVKVYIRNLELHPDLAPNTQGYLLMQQELLDKMQECSLYIFRRHAEEKARVEAEARAKTDADVKPKRKPEAPTHKDVLELVRRFNLHGVSEDSSAAFKQRVIRKIAETMVDDKDTRLTADVLASAALAYLDIKAAA